MAAALSVGCTQKSETGLQVKFDFDFFGRGSEIEDFSSYVSDIKVLELPDSVGFTDVSKMLVSEDGSMIILDSRGVVSSLSADGGEGVKLPHKGRAGNEYVSASDIAIYGDNLIVLDGQEIHIFKIGDPNKNRTIKIDSDKAFDAIAPCGQDSYYVYSSFALKFKDNEKTKDDLLYRVGQDGKVSEEFIPREDCTFSMFNISQSSGNEYYLRSDNNRNIFYRLSGDGASPEYHIDFGDKNIPARYYYDQAGEDIGMYMMSDYFKLPLECHATQDAVYFHVCGPQAADNAAIFSKSKGTGIRWVNSPEDGDVRILGADKDYFYMVTSGVPESEASGPLAKFITSTLESNSVQEGKTCLLKFKVAL